LFSSFDESVEIQELSAWIEDLLPRLEEQSNLIEEANKQLQGPCSFVTGVELTLALCKGIEYYEYKDFNRLNFLVTN
jgi:hypothetical protein